MKAPAAKRNVAAATAATPERGDPRPHYERGNALLFAGDSKGAIAAYREAIRAAPTDPSAFRGLGLAYEQQSETCLCRPRAAPLSEARPERPRPRHRRAPPGTPREQEKAT